MTMGKEDMKLNEVKRMLDKKAMYFWQNNEGRYRLVNSFTLKTALGVNCRIDAIKMTDTLKSEGYSVAPLEDGVLA